jgi:hypothetical protein
MPDWKAEYLKSVESGCITLGELRETRAELEATNRQVEILSDALAESRREVAALKAVQEPVAYEYGNDVFWHDSPDINDYIRANGNALVYSTPPAQPAPDRTGMTYYKNDECKALDSASHDCICWTFAAPVQEPVGYVKEIETPFGNKLKPVLTTPVPVGSKLYTTPPAAQRHQGMDYAAAIRNRGNI